MDISSLIIPIAHAQETAQGGPAATLGLQTQLFIAQLINFGIVLFILWKWVFTPVTKALQARTAKIEKSLADAENIEKDKAEFQQWKQEQLVKAHQEASAIVTKAQSEANQAKDAAVHQTKEEQQKLVEQARRQIEQEKNHQLQSAKAELADLVTNATEIIIKQKLDSKKDEELIKEMLKSI